MKPKHPKDVTKDVVVTHVKGSGPGGQNRNKRMSGVRIVHTPTGIEARVTERRSQAQNLTTAYERLEEKIEKHFFKPTPRKKTKASKSSKRKRLENKRLQGKKKQARNSRPDWD